MDQALHTELWTSWASLLRSYSAAHGMNSQQHAVVEVGADEIVLRAGAHWLRFTRASMLSDTASPVPFALQEDGTVCLGDLREEMDIVAEKIAREILNGAVAAT